MKKKKLFLIVSILFLIVILFYAAGKTYETNRGIWIGYRWYPILHSEREKEKLPCGNISAKQAQKLESYIFSICGRSYWPSDAGVDTIVDISNIAPIKGFRKFVYEGEQCLYCVYNNESGGKLYVVFTPYIDMKYFSSEFFIVNQSRSFADFADIEIGSQRKTVEQIDSLANADIAYLINGRELETSEKQSIHITKEGYLIIKYDGEGCVTDITQYKNAMVEAIQEMEEKDIARQVIKYNEVMLY